MKIVLPYCEPITFETSDNRRLLTQLFTKIQRDIRVGFIRDCESIYIAMDRYGRLIAHSHEPTWNKYYWSCAGRYSQSYGIGSNAHQPNASKSLVAIPFDKFNDFVQAIIRDDEEAVVKFIEDGKQF